MVPSNLFFLLRLHLDLQRPAYTDRAFVLVEAPEPRRRFSIGRALVGRVNWRTRADRKNSGDLTYRLPIEFANWTVTLPFAPGWRAEQGLGVSDALSLPPRVDAYHGHLSDTRLTRGCRC